MKLPNKLLNKTPNKSGTTLGLQMKKIVELYNFQNKPNQRDAISILGEISVTFFYLEMGM